MDKKLTIFFASVEERDVRYLRLCFYRCTGGLKALPFPEELGKRLLLSGIGFGFGPTLTARFPGAVRSSRIPLTQIRS